MTTQNATKQSNSVENPKHKPDLIPSERFLLTQRLFVFLDEWLFYILLTFWWIHTEWIPFTITAILGTLLILNSYKLQWNWERKRFNNKKID